MLSPSDAEKIIAAHVPFMPAEDCPLEHALGRVLRVPIVADRDLPPYDRVTMDGYALRVDGAGKNGGRREFRVIGLQAAGMIPLSISAADECVEVATGAVLPGGANVVVPYEYVVREGGQIVVGESCTAKAGQFVHRRGSDHVRGDVICAAGVRLSSREIAAAAACGCERLRVSMIPRVAIVTTGDELVDVSNPSPAAHQIRRSNDQALRAALVEAGYARVDCVHLRDVEHEIEARMKGIIAEHDVVITTGGVSKGRFDLLPAVFAKLGVEKKLQGVAQRPGKPLWVGVSVRGCVVFGLPGNPVSSHVCFRRYVIPALACASKMTVTAEMRGCFARLAEDCAVSSVLTNYVPVRIEEGADGARVAHVLPMNTSGDVAALVGTDGFVELPPDAEAAGKGNVVRFYPWG